MGQYLVLQTFMSSLHKSMFIIFIIVDSRLLWITFSERCITEISNLFYHPPCAASVNTLLKIAVSLRLNFSGAPFVDRYGSLPLMDIRYHSRVQARRLFLELNQNQWSKEILSRGFSLFFKRREELYIRRIPHFRQKKTLFFPIMPIQNVPFG